MLDRDKSETAVIRRNDGTQLELAVSGWDTDVQILSAGFPVGTETVQVFNSDESTGRPVGEPLYEMVIRQTKEALRQALGGDVDIGELQNIFPGPITPERLKAYFCSGAVKIVFYDGSGDKIGECESNGEEGDPKELTDFPPEGTIRVDMWMKDSITEAWGQCNKMYVTPHIDPNTLFVAVRTNAGRVYTYTSHVSNLIEGDEVSSQLAPLGQIPDSAIVAHHLAIGTVVWCRDVGGLLPILEAADKMRETWRTMPATDQANVTIEGELVSE